ncbi:Cellulose binding domain-containing protein [Lentzea albida]|uniref:Cellulose binding domain-containing protein n=1 Tax=Lentzea albida TaxID=65499 RepID=A0A1H9L8T0_9PSEU|nr:Cellulose binding domain-containing protein [Lentzea albida]
MQVRQPTLVKDVQGELSAVVRKVIDGRTIELDTGERVQVSSLAPPATCWAASARTFAEKRLLAKTVRVTTVTPGEVHLRLEDDTDYASLAVREGALRAQSGAGALADAEKGAEREDRGLWGAPCNGKDTSSSSAAPTTTTAPSSSQPAESSKAAATTTTAPPVVTPTAAAATCTVAYRVDNQWQGGFQGRVTIRNNGGSSINGWTLRWSFADGQTVREVWNATVSQRNGSVSVTGVDQARTIPSRGEVTIGFIGASGGRNTAPSSFTLNEAACTTG